MRTLLVSFVIATTLSAQNYTFLVSEYTKETELEAKIVSNIAEASLNKSEIRLFIPEISELEERVYSNFVTLTSSCSEADFVFVKRSVDVTEYCQDMDKVYVTNNYSKLLSDQRYIGAFFWQKSRPNITFLNKRLQKKQIQLPSNYEKFVEDF